MRLDPDSMTPYEIRQAIDTYPHFDGDGLKVFPPSKKRFAWSPDGSRNKLCVCVAGYLMAHIVDMVQSQQMTDAFGAPTWPHLTFLQSVISRITGFPEIQESKQLCNRLATRAEQLQELELDLKDAFKRITDVILDEKIDEGKLLSAGHALLRETTNLTDDNVIRHVVDMLDHFGVTTDDWSRDPYERIKKWTYRVKSEDFVQLFEARSYQAEKS